MKEERMAALRLEERASRTVKKNLKDFDLGWVCGADVETLQVRFKHPLWIIKTGRKKKYSSEPAAPLVFDLKFHTHKTPPGVAHPSLDSHCCHILKNNILDFTGGRDRNRTNLWRVGFKKDIQCLFAFLVVPCVLDLRNCGHTGGL